MENLFQIVSVVLGVVIGVLVLLVWRRGKQVLEERRNTARERALRVVAENVAEDARLKLKKMQNLKDAEDMTDEEATDSVNDALDRFRSDDGPSGDEGSG